MITVLLNHCGIFLMFVQSVSGCCVLHSFGGIVCFLGFPKSFTFS